MNNKFVVFSYHFSRPFSKQRVNMTIALELLSQHILQKSSRVECNGPCVTINSLGELCPGT